MNGYVARPRYHSKLRRLLIREEPYLFPLLVWEVTDRFATIDSKLLLKREEQQLRPAFATAIEFLLRELAFPTV